MWMLIDSGNNYRVWYNSGLFVVTEISENPLDGLHIFETYNSELAKKWMGL